MVEVRKTGVLRRDARPKEIAASRLVSEARLNSASPVSLARDFASRGGRAEAPLYLMFSDREGRRVSKVTKKRDGTSHRAMRSAVTPTISILRGEWLRTSVDQVM